MKVEDLLNKTKQNYEFAMECGDDYLISNVLKGYETFSNLYRLDMITTETFDKYFNNFYIMANNVCVKYMQDNKEKNESVKMIMSIPFIE